MKLTWVNHASYILEYENVKIICDPWIEGRVFNKSWALISKSKFTFNEFESITHIWFSHEHPDHFFPPNLIKIPKHFREKITVIFYKTIDKKVVEFCKNNNFKKIIELNSFEKYNLSENFSITLGKVEKDSDSWAFFETKENTLLNVNDCVLSDNEINLIKNSFIKIDVLLTQFSFANWVGNKDDKVEIADAANKKLLQLKNHIVKFSPNFVIPFASYVWFCSIDNFYFNQFANKIDNVYNFIEGLNCNPIVLYPGDKWAIGEYHNSLHSIEKYLFDSSKINENELTKFSLIPISMLEKEAIIFKNKALKRNNKIKLLLMNPLIIHLNDYNQVYSFSFKKGFNKINLKEEFADISFKSQNLLYCFKYDWGFETILIAGTFQKPKKGNFNNFLEFEWISKLNNQGKRMDSLLIRIFKKLFN